MVKNLLSIGEMAELCGMTIQRLRYYSNIELIVPAYTDPKSNYRYYTIDQKQTIFVVQTLQYLGLTLEEIAAFITNNLDSEHTAERIEHYIQQEEEKLNRIKLITAILFEKQQTTSKPDFFSTIEFECSTQKTAFDFAAEWKEATSFFRAELIKRELSLSYLFFCGIKQQEVDGQKKFSYYIELPGISLDAAIVEKYADYEEMVVHHTSYEALLEKNPSVYVLKLPEINVKNSYRILKLKV